MLPALIFAKMIRKIAANSSPEAVEKAIVALFPRVVRYRGGDLVFEANVERDGSAVYITVSTAGYMYSLGPWNVVDTFDGAVLDYAGVRVVLGQRMSAHATHDQVGLLHLARGVWAASRRWRDARHAGSMGLWQVCASISAGDRSSCRVELSTSWNNDAVIALLADLEREVLR